MSERRHWT
jgi:hypothetical protein